ncbi:TetR family transcriptional regulator [Ornithinibacillus massiliensis]|uniref:TetR family transcriptional regulator n=1 Tax=Ornithinibacillus massiliensis TaxID=1944633 RepID=A0ABS5MDI6_9BACI|nr:TetR family transcriptional regulator [Ornithinibacillus massiliensis]MBS3680394.1 TetR family transcriptional regulator [Ornithinibacillus massiliensis]
MDNKKERIIHAAMDVFTEKGLEKTKVSDIVKKAGIAQGTFYIYFSSKLSVVPSIAEVMVEKTLSEIIKKVNKNDPFSEQMKDVIDVAFSVTKEYRQIFALVYAGLASTDYLQEWEALYSQYYSWMSRFLGEAKEAGTLRQNLDPDQTAVLLIDLIESAAEQTFLYSHGDKDMEAIKKKEVWEFSMYGLGVKVEQNN